MRRTRFSDPDHVRLLANPSWLRCEGLIKGFEEAWQRGQGPAVVDFLRAEGPARQALLVELVHVDLEFRLKSGEAARVEAYLEAYPELADDRRASLELIAAEYDLRQRLQGGVHPAEYRHRFPEYWKELFDFLGWAEADTPDPAHATFPTAEMKLPAVSGYDILGEIGRGGMGVVYKASDPDLGRHVALKFLPEEYAHDPDRLDRFLREARTASALNHPNICTVHALGQHEGRPFIVMEFIEGYTLQALIGHRPGLDKVARLVRQAARALAAAHAAGVVHRDIKPDNVMVRADGYVKVLDFGLARRLPTLVSAGEGDSRDTDPGAIVGTVAYMSPEQARGAAAVSASDIFSLGIVLYQLATGQHPFEADSALGTLYAIASRQPVPPTRLNHEVPATLDGLIEAMLSKDAGLRPTAAEVEATLAPVAGRDTIRLAPPAAPRAVVRREPELAVLRAAYAAADAGRGSVVCVAGEPGIGKTTLVENFLDGLAEPGQACLLARGHCSERLADTEAYLPLIDALQDLLRTEAGGSMARLMKIVAPTWYAQVAPAATDPSAPRRNEAARASSQPAMLREFVSLLREASRRGTVVLFFDDVHWADVPTVDLLAHLGRHCSDDRVLVVVTYRPTELLLGPHPFHAVKLELQGRGVCHEVALGFLSRDDIDHYLTLAFPDHTLPADFAALVHSRTEGNPLFMADLLRYLRERGAIAQAGGHWSLARELPDLWQELPESVRGMIQRKLERLVEADRRLLAAASVQGPEFDSAVVARALNLDAAEVEERLQVLDRVHGLVRLAREYEFPDRTLTQRYAFVHVLYQQALYTDLPPSRRAALGAALARVLEAHAGEGNPAVAAELACLYEVGRDFARAAKHCIQAARNAARVFAHREAVVLARRGLRLLETLPETPERAALELPLQTTLGLQLQVTEGFAAPEVQRAYTRARVLCMQTTGTPPFPVLWGLWLFHKVRSELALARERAEELLTLARQQGDSALVLQAHQAMTVTCLCQGEPATAARHMAEGAALYDPDRHRAHSFLFGQDPGVACKAIGAVAVWLRGYPDEALRQSDEAVRLSHELAQPSSQTLALHFAAMLHQCRRDTPRTRACAEACAGIAAEHGFSFWRAGGAVMSGWALDAARAKEDGIARMRRGLLDWVATGSVTYQTYYLGLLAEALGARRQVAEAWRTLEEALDLVRKTGEGLYEAELYRLRGELLVSGPGEPEAAALRRGEDNFRQALDVARRQEAKSLELRAAMSLARLGRRLDKTAEAQGLLAETYGWFAEGFETPDLREARMLLEGSTM